MGVECLYSSHAYVDTPFTNTDGHLEEVPFVEQYLMNLHSHENICVSFCVFVAQLAFVLFPFTLQR